VASANVDLVRSILAAWEEGDLRSVEWADPGIELVFADGPVPGTYKGLAGVAEAFRDFLTVWEGFRVFAEEIRELDDERVLALTRAGGRGKSSGVDLAQTRATAGRMAHLFHIRRSKVVALAVYLDRDLAIGELGVQPTDTGA
jgi:ketosteroid isomerase-like protein